MRQIPPDDMVLVWRTDEDRRISGSMMRRAGLDTAETATYSKSWGACAAGWLDGKPLSSPLGLFTKLAALNGFASEDALREMLQQFAMVDGQDWAIELLWELDGRPDR